MDLSLVNKTAVVCGSTQGIGLAIAQELSQLGARCLLLARNEQTLKQAVSSLDDSKGQQHSYYAVDFTKTEDLRSAIDKISSEQIVHILINNTGGPAPGPIIEAREEDFIAAFNQHLIGNQILTKALVPGMKTARYGRIINIISTSVKIPIKNLGVSNTIRWAVASWSKTMANELGQYNITVNNILPGYTQTQRLKEIIEHSAQKQKTNEEELTEEMISDIPAKRFGTPAEIAAVTAFLASPAASYVNGASIPVDGGKTGSI